MNRISMLISHNIRKEKGSFLSFGIIVIIASLIFNLSMILALNIDQAYDRNFEELNTADMYENISIQSNPAGLVEKIKAVNDVEYVEHRNGILLEATLPDFQSAEFTMATVFYNKSDPHQLNTLRILKNTEATVSNPIYIPKWIADMGPYSLGDNYNYIIGGREYRFTIAGIVEEMQYGNYGLSIIGVYLEKNEYENLLSQNKDNEISSISIRTKENSNNDQVFKNISELLAEEGATVFSGSFSSRSKSSRTVVTTLIVAIFVSFSVLVLLVSLFLSNFRIKNNIEEELTSMGTLMAIGYTSRQIIMATTLPYVIVSLASSVIGIGLSYLLLPLMLRVVEIQSGFSWQQGFDPLSTFLTLVIILGLVALFTYLAAKKIRRMKPINAIRGLDSNTKRNKNHFPIDRTNLNINLILMLKNTASSLRQNILLFMVLFLATILAMFSGILFYNVVLEPDNFVTTLSEELPTVKVSSNSITKEEIASIENVEEAIYYTNETIKIKEDTITAFISDNYDNVKNDLIYEGRNPTADNEIAIGSKLVENYNFKINDNLMIQHGDHTSEYLIVGFIQSINYDGAVCELTNSGFSRLRPDYTYNSFYVYLEDETQTEKFIAEIKAKFGSKIESVENHYETRSSVISMYSTVVQALCIFIMTITCLIIFLILYVIIKSIIIKRKQEFGIYKSIGYSNRQLIMQIAGSFMPCAILAVGMSVAICRLYMMQIIKVIFGLIGAMKTNFTIPVTITIAVFLVIISFTLMIAMFLSMKIKKISAYSLIKE